MRWRVYSASLVSWALAISGCATQRGVHPLRVMVLPLDAAGLQRGEAEQLREALARSVSDARRAEVVRLWRTDEAIALVPACSSHTSASRIACAAAAAARLGADRAVLSSVGLLAGNFLLRVHLVDPSGSATVRSVERRGRGGIGAVARELYPLARQLFPPPVQPPWFSRWWVWTAIVAGAVVTAVAVALPIAAGGGSAADYVPVPLPGAALTGRP